MKVKTLFVLLALVLAIGFSGCSLVDGGVPAYEDPEHPAAVANKLCASHGGVENVATYYGSFNAATCKDGTAVEIGE